MLLAQGSFAYENTKCLEWNLKITIMKIQAYLAFSLEIARALSFYGHLFDAEKKIQPTKDKKKLISRILPTKINNTRNSKERGSTF